MKNIALTIAVLLAGANSYAKADLIGPTPYLEFSDSPFADALFSQFYLEDFEDGALNTLGVTASTGFARGPSPFTDSVDGDDGIVVGFGTDGWDFTSPQGQTGDAGIMFTFDALALGQLPTHVGIVWTDGGFDSPTLFEAFDENGVSIGIIGPIHISDNSFAGTTGEDRFFGAINANGISGLLIRDPGSADTIQVDHLQYGVAIPEPSTVVLLSLAGLFFTTKRRNRTKR